MLRVCGGASGLRFCCLRLFVRVEVAAFLVGFSGFQWRRLTVAWVLSSDSGGFGLAVRLGCAGGGEFPGVLVVGGVVVWAVGWVVLLID